MNYTNSKAAVTKKVAYCSQLTSCGSNQHIRKRGDNASLCKHCNKQCTETGEQALAIQCDLCGVWVCAVCDGISPDQYQGLISLTSSIENLAYLCKLNSCQARFKQLIFEIGKAKNDNNEI